jgi:hypothetical protein
MDNLTTKEIEDWLRIQQEEFCGTSTALADLFASITGRYNKFLLEKLTKEKGE